MHLYKNILLIGLLILIPSTSYSFVGALLNNQSEKAFIKSFRDSISPEKAKRLQLQAAKAQKALMALSATGAAVAAVTAMVVAGIVGSFGTAIGDPKRWEFWVSGMPERIGKEMSPFRPLQFIAWVGIVAMGVATAYCASVSIKAAKRARRYKKFAQNIPQLRAINAQLVGESNRGVLLARAKAVKRGLNIQLITAAALALVSLIALIVAYNKSYVYRPVSRVVPADGSLSALQKARIECYESNKEELRKQGYKDYEFLGSTGGHFEGSGSSYFYGIDRGPHWGWHLAVLASFVPALYAAYGVKNTVRKKILKKELGHLNLDKQFVNNPEAFFEKSLAR